MNLIIRHKGPFVNYGHNYTLTFVKLGRYPSHDGHYRDYMSTFDAGGYDDNPNDMETI